MKLTVRPVLWLTSAVAIALLFSLGTWQVKRLQWKNGLIAQVEARLASEPVDVFEALALQAAGEDIEYLPVRVVGGFPNADTAHVPGTYEGQPGAYAFQVMRLDAPAGKVLLLNRGFVPQDLRSDYYPLPDAESVVGLVRAYRGSTGLAAKFAPPDRPDDLVFFSRDRSVLGGALAPGQAEDFLPFALDSQLATDLPQGQTTRLEFRNSHLGYAITWYGLAFALFVMTGAMSRQRMP